jgi:small subunit ribosomal protein S1
VEARVTGHNAGGLECEVNRLRGFIPVSQISLYRVENLEEFVDQKFTCLVTEANPQRRNLVLSRRAVLEREREEARATILESLAPGQVREGVVRKVLDFGAFVDLGSGVDGLLHVSQLGWGRVKHPSEVVQEGQKISVRVDKVDRESRKISLSYRDLLENPWTGADRKYVVNTVVRSKVVKIMEYGAFVELEPGVEGLVHISELSHKRVPRVSDVVKEGDEIDAVVLSVDPKAQRISLSMKNVNPPPEAEAAAPAPAAEEPPAKPKPPRQPARPLKGGLGRSPRGSKFGLNW